MEFNQVVMITGLILAIGFLATVGALFFVSRRSQKVMESMLLLLTRPERAKVQDAARVLHTVLGDEMNKIESNFQSMQAVLASHIAQAEELKNDLSVRNDALVELAEGAVKKISVMTQRLENTVDGFQNVVGSSEWDSVEKSSERFSSRINDLLSRIDTVSQDTVDRTSVLQNHIDGWIESGKTLSGQLQQDTDSYLNQMNTMVAESENMQQKLSDLSKSVSDGFETVKSSAADYEGLMAANDKLLGSQLDKMDAFTKQSKTLLTSQTNTLTNTANAVGGQIRLAETSIEKQVEKLAAVVENLMASATATESAVRNISTELATLTGRFNNEIKEFAVGVVGELNTVSGVANTTLESTRSAANAFSDSVRAMATGVRETLMEMNTAHAQLSGQSEGLIKMSAETTSQLQPLSELIERYYIALPDLTAGSVEMGEKLEQIVAALNTKIELIKDTVSESMTSIADSSVKLDQLSGQSRQQMIDLMSDYAKAVDTMQTLNKQMVVARATAPMDAIRAPAAASYGRVSSQDFIKQSEKLMEKMHEQSVDLTRSVGAEIPDAVWKKYHAGDKTIFTKWFVKILAAADKRQIRDLIKRDNIFKSQSMQYIRSFEKILSAAKQSDSSEMLTETLLKSDLGKVYITLKNYV